MLERRQAVYLRHRRQDIIVRVFIEGCAIFVAKDAAPAMKFDDKRFKAILTMRSFHMIPFILWFRLAAFCWQRFDESNR